MSAQASQPLGEVAANDSQIIPGEAAVSSEDPTLPELERELAKRLKTGRAALPVLPAVAQSAIRLANDPDARITELASLVDTDPPIAARFMSVANSVIYFRGWVTSSTQSAIVRLGLASTRDLLFQVVYASTSGGLKKYQAAVQESFRKSVIAAHAARVASRELSIGSEYDYMSGLLHDIGESRIYRILDGLKAPSTPALVAQLVRKYHESAGAEVAMAWKLPTEIVDACAAHHDPAAAATPHVRLVMIADCVVDALEAELGQEKRELDFEPFDKLLVDPRIARRLIEKTRPFLAHGVKI
ncbi:MAG TPA: HDOD domain-containing protein [Polyangiaceae bacterium]|nr:HDOD domain-containing protein [Polyangiaceae bacterium]